RQSSKVALVNFTSIVGFSISVRLFCCIHFPGYRGRRLDDEASCFSRLAAARWQEVVGRCMIVTTSSAIFHSKDTNMFTIEERIEIVAARGLEGHLLQHV
ncbi:hypothetical protein L9F63_008453, partial [Diploptera punctata]